MSLNDSYGKTIQVIQSPNDSWTNDSYGSVILVNQTHVVYNLLLFILFLSVLTRLIVWK